jgi:hypothetical protein
MGSSSHQTERVSAPRKAVSSPGAQEPDWWRESHCKWDLLCCHDGYVCGSGVSSRLWQHWMLVTPRLDGDLLDVPVLHDGYQETGSVAYCYGVLYHCVHCICKSLFRRFVHSIHLILAHTQIRATLVF